MKSLLPAVVISLLVAPVANVARPSSPDVIWRKFDEYSKLSFKKQKQRLANFIIQLQNEPSAVAYVVSYSGRVSCPNEAQSRADRVRNYLLSAGQLEPKRIKTIDAGHNDDWVIELWVGPAMAPPLTKESVTQGFLHLSADQVKMAANCNRAGRGNKSKRRRA